MNDYKKLYEDLCKAITDNTGNDEEAQPIVYIRYIADEMEVYNNSITK
jgi:hypothetical protein